MVNNIKTSEISRRQFVKYTIGPVVFMTTGDLLTACGGSDGPPPASSKQIIFGSMHPVNDHPVVQSLLNLSAIVQDGTGQGQHGLLIDGNKINATDLAASAVIKDYILGDKALLLLNCSGEHKQALVKHIGIAFGNDASPGYFIIPEAGSQGRKMAIHDHPRAKVASSLEFVQAFQNSGKKIELDHAKFQAEQEQFRHEIEDVSGPKNFAATIMKAVTANALSQSMVSQGALVGDSAPQPKQMVWTYSPRQSWSYSNYWLNSENVWAVANSPMSGFQQGTITPTTAVTLYLDNKSTNQTDNFQYLVVDHHGVSNPATDHSIYVKDTNVAMPLDGSTAYYIAGTLSVYAWPLAWAQMKYNFSFMPAPAAAPTVPPTSFVNPVDLLQVYSAQPPTQNATTSYTSGYSISVGASKDGPNVSATIENSTTTDISDWELNNNTNNGTLVFDWDWYSANPLNTSNFSTLNKLNTAIFQPNATCVMKSNSLLTQTLLFNMSCGVTQLSLDAVFTLGEIAGRTDVVPAVISLPVSIDFGSVLLPSLESLTISPNSVKGGTATTGTVTLDSSAPVGGTIVNLSSSLPCASVPKTVTVPAGQAAMTFPITTSPVTGNSAATIKGSFSTDVATAPVSSMLTVTS